MNYQTTPTAPLGLLWPRNPITQPLNVTTQRARRRFVEQNNCQPVAVLINPRHRADVSLVQPLGQGGSPTLLGLPVRFDEMVRPYHVFLLGPEGDEQQKEASAVDTLTSILATPKE